MPILSGGGGGGGGGAIALLSQTVLVAQGSFNVTSIPQTGNDLQLVLIARDSSGPSGQVNLQFNGDATGGNYSYAESHEAGGSVAGSQGNTATSINLGVVAATGTAPANVFGSCLIYLPGYASTTRQKTVMSQPNVGFTASGSSNTRWVVGWWLSTAAINRVTIAGTGPYEIGSELRIYSVT